MDSGNALVGAAAGATGVGASAWAAGASFGSVAAGTTSLGFGATVAGGAAAGFVSGSASAWTGGASFGEGLGAGFIGAAFGGTTAGAFYGLSKAAGSLADKYFNKTMKTAYAYEYTVDQVTGTITKVSNLGGADTHFYHIGTYVDNGTAFLSPSTRMVTGINTINAFRFWESAQSTISAFSAPASGLTGFFLEPAGPSTTIRNQDRRVPAGVYNLTPNMNSYPDDFMIYNDLVPMNRGITIHSGNHPDNTLGCLLPRCSWGDAPGKYAKWGDNWVGKSGAKLKALRAHINKLGYKNVQVNIFDVFGN